MFYFLSFLFLAIYSILGNLTLAEEIVLEPILISSSRLGQKYLRAGEVLTSEEIDSIPTHSISDLLSYFTSVDIRRRNIFGIQGDLSIRGSNFEQNLLLLDGLKLYDPQTGHHLMNLPLTIFDIERIEVLRGQASGLYGPGAFGGVVNILTKKPKEKKFIYQGARGENDLWLQGFSLTQPLGSYNTRFSYEYKQASSYRPETDFIQRNFYGSILKNCEDRELNFALGFMDKDFGAGNFYSEFFPYQRENIQTRFAQLFFKKDVSRISLYHRWHKDHFMLDKNRPGWNENFHKTYVYGLEFEKREKVGEIDLGWGIDLGYDKITSTKLNKHSRNRKAIFFELGSILKEKFIFNLSLREDYYSDWAGNFSPNLNLGYFIDDNLKLRGSIGKAFRVPTYTELYYHDSANIGNPNLIPEKALSWEIGWDKNLEKNLVSFTFFKRKTKNTIDWIRDSPLDRTWEAKNIGEIFFKGAELDLKFGGEKELHSLVGLEKFGYSYIESDRKEELSLSKYVLDHTQHQFVLNWFNLLPFGFKQSWILSYKERNVGSGYFVLDTRIQKKISHHVEIFLDGTNLTNTNYYEINKVFLPKRWLILGLRFTF